MAFDVNTFKQALRDFVLGDGAVTGIVGTRVFFAQLATLRDVVFPAVTFRLLEGEDTLSFLRDFDVVVNAHSDDNYDQAHSLFDAVRTRLNHVIISPRIVIRPRTSPSEVFDEISRLYTVSGRFRVNWLN